MGEINNHIQNRMPQNFIKNGRARKEFEQIRNNFCWAKEYIYGIEKDYRLAKTTKIATFLNGDGDATIVCGDGLDNFHKSEEYKNKLHLDENKKNNERFDIVIANPPYSVSGFTTTLKNGKESFDLFDNFTNKSNEIECLFVERTRQLLREGGVAGIILPTNILEGSGIYSKVRERIFENFDIKAIVKLGKNTFMATNTATIILFLTKVKNNKSEIMEYISKSIKTKKDSSINNIEKPIQKYLSSTYGIEFIKYLNFFNNDNLDDSELNKIKLYSAYIEAFKKQNAIKKLSEYVTIKELDKLCYFILTYEKNVILYMIPPNNLKEEKKILGYGFSDRKGYEGIYIFNQGGKLYNPQSLDDNDKINYYILKNFNNENFELKKDIKGLFKVHLHKLIEFNDSNCEKAININSYEVYKDNTESNANKAIIKLKRKKVVDEGKVLLEGYKKTEKIENIPIKQVTKKNRNGWNSAYSKFRILAEWDY